MAIDKSDLSPAVAAHFGSLKNQHIEVPEWSTDELPCVIHFDPLTVQERIELADDQPDFLARVLIRKALKPDGSKWFTLADLPMLLHNASALVVARVANRILNADAVDPAFVEEFSAPAEKTEPS
jgi:hypothetical protein